jgi:hypothetical protein
MKLSGHKTESIYRRYAIVSEADLAEGVRKVVAMRAASGSDASTENSSEPGIPARRAQFRAQSGDVAGNEHTADSSQPLEGIGAGGGGRTLTRGEPNGILSTKDEGGEEATNGHNRAHAATMRALSEGR